MRDIDTKVTGDTLSADEFNDIPDELESAITSTGIALSAGGLTQLSQSIVNYAGNGDFYTDSGSGTAYQLGIIGTNQQVPGYADGQQIRFIAANTNTGTAPTVQVGALGAVTITDTAGAVIVTGDIQAGSVITLSYDDVSSKFFLFEAFRTNSTETTSGVIEIATDAETQTGTDATRAVTPAGLQSKVASTTVKGIVELATDAETQTGTDATRSVTPASLASFSSDLTAATGHATMPGGLIIQWGSTGAVSSGATISFDISFTTLFAITVTPKNESTNIALVSTINETVSGFDIPHEQGEATAEFFYIALGI